MTGETSTQLQATFEKKKLFNIGVSYMHGVRFGKALWVFSVVLTFGLLMSLTAFAQTVTLSAPVSRVNASAINNSNRVTLKGHVRPFLANATDQGKVADGQKVGPIMLMLARTP